MNGNDTTTDTGKRGEAQAAVFLEQHGLKVVARNYRCRGGELDLVCREGRTLVFVEVRYRASRSHGGAAASITRSKQRKLWLTAQTFLLQQGLNESNQACRFDVVAFDGSDACQWYKNAIQGT